jgi:hypothetical protein
MSTEFYCTIKISFIKKYIKGQSHENVNFGLNYKPLNFFKNFLIDYLIPVNFKWHRFSNWIMLLLAGFQFVYADQLTLNQ